MKSNDEFPNGLDALDAPWNDERKDKSIFKNVVAAFATRLRNPSGRGVHAASTPPDNITLKRAEARAPSAPRF